MKTRQKENALNEFIDMIEHSWTYGRMTDTWRLILNHNKTAPLEV